VLKFLRRVIPAVIGMGLVLFLLCRAARLRELIPEYPWQADYHLLCLSFLILTSSLFLLAVAWYYILRKLGANLRPLAAVSAYFYSNLLRYVPGTFWYTIGRVHLAKRQDVPEDKSSVSLVLELCFSVLSALLVGAGTWVIAPGSVPVLAILGTILFLLVIIWPPFFLRLVNGILRAIRREEIALALRYRDMLLLLTPYVAFWIIYGTGFWVLLRSVYSGSLPSLWATITICALSWVAGFVSFPIPQGIGVREAVMAHLLGAYVPFAVASVVALASRLLMLLAEVACAAISVITSTALSDPLKSDGIPKGRLPSGSVESDPLPEDRWGK